jgi:DNA phosphorothioation-dependent restriction protein DptH
MPDTLITVLAEALARLLGRPEPGNMAFVRCLPWSVATDLVTAHRDMGVNGWRIAAVAEGPVESAGYITAAQAVERREDKGDATLLLIDSRALGSGLDGIFNATREVAEPELLGEAAKCALQRLPHDSRRFVSAALNKAGWKRRRQPLAPWLALDYLCRTIADRTNMGTALPIIGLWPIAIGDHADTSVLDHSALLVERLLPIQGARSDPDQRVAALNLGAEQEESARHLINYLRTADGRPRLQALDGLSSDASLWLNNLRLPPSDQLQQILIKSWRRQNGSPYEWSGLINSDGDFQYRLSPDGQAASNQKPLCVKWSVVPGT